MPPTPDAEEIHIVITPEGNIKTLWTDALPLTEMGKCEVERISHVEFSNLFQSWSVFDIWGMNLQSGFKTREEALAWERRWANDRLRRGDL